MGLIPLTFELVSVFVLTAYLINKYSNLKKQNFVVTVSTFIGWFFSFIIIFVLPLDVAITFFNKCQIDRARTANATGRNGTECELPGGYVPDALLLNLWRIVYWTAQLLTWIVLPLLQSYVTAGDFTKWGKFRAAVYNNALYYGIYTIFFVMLLVYALLKGIVINSEHLKVILVSASNTWGLFLLVVLLGYGLVELPRSLWYTGRKSYRLNKAYFDIEKLASDKSEAEENLKDAYRQARAVLNVVKNDSSARDKAQIIISKFPENVINELFPARNATEFSAHRDTNSRAVGSEKYLIRLHKKAIDCIQAHQRASAQWRETIDHALFLEDVAQAESMRSRLVLQEGGIVPKWIRELWYVSMRRPVCKVLGGVLSLMTMFVLVSECTFFVVSPTLSPAALLTDYAAQRFHYKYTQFVAMAIIFYLCSCAYFTIFRLKIYRYYHLDPNGHTDENSLLFSAILLCRLTPPICLNFLGTIHLDSHISLAKDFGVETQFTKLMGHLDLISILSKGINIYLPICIIFFCAIHYYRLGTYALHSLGFDQFMEADEFTKDMVKSGRALVQIERNSTRRKEERAKRNENFQSRMKPKPTTVTARASRLPEDERPMIGFDEDGDDEWSGEWSVGRTEGRIDDRSETRLGTGQTEPRLLPVSSPLQQQREHPNSANFFDDM